MVNPSYPPITKGIRTQMAAILVETWSIKHGQMLLKCLEIAIARKLYLDTVAILKNAIFSLLGHSLSLMPSLMFFLIYNSTK